MKIWLCDLTHDQQVLASDTMPTNIGSIASYVLDKSAYSHSVRLFKYPGKLIEAIEAGDLPDLIGFSYFMWNARLSYALASEIKALKPSTVVVFGGLNYPLEESDQRAWLLKHQNVDFYVVKEGEVGFHQLVDRLVEVDLDIRRAKSPDLSGVHYHKDGVFHNPPPAPRVRDLDTFPSPYLSGLLDEFFDGKLMPLMTTNRGCPFSCAFCAEGQKYYSIVNHLPLDRIREEAEYIGKKMQALPPGSSRRDVYISDSNFGMYKQDLEIAKIFSVTREKYGWPEFVKATTGKNQTERVIEVARTLNGALTLAGSVQSLDTEVLSNINRSNIRIESLMKMAQEAKRLGSSSYSDVILALPGDSYDSHVKSVSHLVDSGFDYMALYTLRLQADAEMARHDYRQKFGLKGLFRVLTRSYGSYPIFDRYLNVAEVEEVCVEGIGLPFSDYLKARAFDVVVGIFYYDQLMDSVFKVLGHFDISRSHWLYRVLEIYPAFPRLNDIIQRFVQETRDELWEDEDTLNAFTSDRDNILKYISGEFGANLLGTYRLRALMECLEDVLEIGAQAAIDRLKEANAPAVASELVREATMFESERRRGLYDEDVPATVLEFNYDIPTVMMAETLQSVEAVRLPAPRSVRFFRTEETQQLIERNNKIFGTSTMGRYKQWTRTPWRKRCRSVEYL